MISAHLLMLATVHAPSVAHVVPAYARQTGLACSAAVLALGSLLAWWQKPIKRG